MATATEKKPAASKAKAVAKPKAIKKVAAKKVPVKKTSTAKTTTVKISAAERYRMVETAAYFIAERNGFTGNSADYWIAAEAQIKKMLAK
jgi:hypothetical protein